MAKVESFERDELLKCGYGEMFGPGNAQLPIPNMLMMDRITRIADSGGKFDKGEIIGELDIKPDLWFFDCHFPGDPVMPGCLGLDAMWQSVGFFRYAHGYCSNDHAQSCGDAKDLGIGGARLLLADERLSGLI